VLGAQTIKLSAVTATVGVDYDFGKQMVDPKWQLDTSVGRAIDVRATADGCTLSKNWDADLGAMSCNVELRGHCTWSGRVRSEAGALRASVRVLCACPNAVCCSRLVAPLLCYPAPPTHACEPQPTLSVDVVPIKTVTKAVTGGVAFAVGKSLDVAPRIKLGKLPLKVCLHLSAFPREVCAARLTCMG
jgi:hypothetical protein